MKILHINSTGPLLRYGDGTLAIDDLNPETHIKWTIGRKTMLGIAWRAFVAAIFN